MTGGTSDVIQVDINSDITQAEKCRKALENIAAKAYNLDDALRQGTISYDKYNKEIEKLAAQSAKVNAAFDAATGTIQANTAAAAAAAAANKSLSAEEAGVALAAVQAARQAAKDKTDAALKAAQATAAAAQQAAQQVKAAAEAEKQAARDAAAASRQAKKAQDDAIKQADKAQAAAAKQTARELAAASKQTAQDLADAAKEAARAQSAADKQAARDKADAAKQANAAAKQTARDQATAAQQVADATKKAAKDQADAAKQAARDQIQAARQTAAAARQAARDQADAAAQVVAAQKSQAAATQRADQDMANANRRSGQRILSMARLFDDLQYVPQQGLRPIINNLIELNPVLGIAAIGVQTLYNNWGTLVGLFSGGAVKTQAEDMEELGKKVHTTADEYDRLARYQAGDKSVKELREARPQAEKDADERTKKAIGEAGGSRPLIAGVLKARPDLVAQSGVVEKAQKDVDALKKSIATHEKNLADPSWLTNNALDKQYTEKLLASDQKLLLRKKQELLDATRDSAEGMVAGALDSRFRPEARKQLTDIIRANPEAFGAKGKQLLADLDLIGQGKDPADVKKEAEQAKKKDEQENEKRQTELTRDLQDRFNLGSAGGNEINRATIEEELKRGGVSDAEIGKHAAAVLAKLQQGYADELRSRAGKFGFDLDGAKADILAEGQKKLTSAAEARQQAADKKQDTAEQRRAKELADPLQERFNEESARGGRDDAVPRETIDNELSRAGQTDEEVQKYGAATYAKLQDGYNEALRKKAEKAGVDTPRANDLLVQEAEDKRTKTRDKMLDAARQSAEEAERNRADEFKRQTAGTGIDAQTRNALLRSQFSAKPERAVERYGQSLERSLLNQGMDPRQAQLATREHLETEMAKLNDEIRTEALREPETKAPEQKDFMAFAHQLTLGDVPKQTLDVNKQMLERLVSIDRQAGGGLILR